MPQNKELKQVKILLPIAVSEAFNYLVPEGMSVELGSLVIVPFGNKELRGVVWSDADDEYDPNKVKQIKFVSDLPEINKDLRDFIVWVSNYTLAPLGSVLAMVISAPGSFEPPKPQIAYKLSKIGDEKITKARQKVIDLMQDGRVLSTHDIKIQAEVSDAVIRGLIKNGSLEQIEVPDEEKADFKEAEDNLSKLSADQKSSALALIEKVKDQKYSTTLLDGITGSGKTEVYFEAIVEALKNNQQVLVLLPEIILTTQLLERFKKRFGFTPLEWHSSLTAKKRRENWRMISKGSARLIIGARSALFLPYKNLGLIIVDEEHETSFKQEEGVVYHGRDMAVARASVENIPAILVSASPSLETVLNVRADKFSRLHLSRRHGVATLPDVEVVDMRAEKLKTGNWLSERVRNELTESLEYGEQSMLYLNRRGYAPLTLCRKCGYRFECPDCSTWLVEHKNPPYLQCHHCGFAKMIPHNCPSCDEEDSFASCGPGVERIEEEVRSFLPDARLAVMTSDTMTSPEKAEATVRNIENGNIDIIIGTQMVAKGYHFPKLTFVCIVDADLGLEGGDVRAVERSYQLLHQVAGRAGREDLKGRALFQSYMPDNIIMQTLTEGDRDGFIEKELERRRKNHMPPFSRFAALILSGVDEEKVRKSASEMVRKAPRAKGVKVLGPAPAPILRLRKQFRYRLLVIADRNINIQRMIESWLNNYKIPSWVKLKIDIDPYSFY